MPQTCEGPPRRGSADGLDEAISLEGNASNLGPSAARAQDKFRNPRAVKEARLELLREAVHEACAFIRIHAEVCQSLAEAGDNAGLIHSLGRLVAYTKHAARNGNELRAIRDEAASNKEGGQ